ncbi:hypothetical protein, partial [Frederiksenia canicola]
MKKSLLTLLVLGASVSLAACDQAKEKSAEVKQAAETKMEQAKEATADAMKAAEAKAGEMKDAAAAK